jgi:BRCT domain type II-containing protein
LVSEELRLCSSTEVAATSDAPEVTEDALRAPRRTGNRLTMSKLEGNDIEATVADQSSQSLTFLKFLGVVCLQLPEKLKSCHFQRVASNDFKASFSRSSTFVIDAPAIHMGRDRIDSSLYFLGSAGGSCNRK